MGIDIYAKWKGQGEEERKEQEGALFSIDAGHIGYLREAYHGEPYATTYLMPEAFEHPQGVPIAASILRKRLPETLRQAELRARTVYGKTEISDIEAALDSFRAFVALCERVERETGEPVTIMASW